jgi:predicted RNA-binding protein with PIN domain
MRFIVDGYNIIKSGLAPEAFEGKTLEQQRNALLELISLNKPQGSPRNTVTVVFDGDYQISLAAGPGRPPAGVEKVIFTEGGSADEKIEELVLSESNPTEVAVVTNDKGIKRRIGGTGARIVVLEEFLPRLLGLRKKWQKE